MMGNATFSASSHQGLILIQRNNVDFKITLSPAETDKATGLIASVLSMQGLSHAPDRITHTPFVIRFFPDNKYALERVDREGSLPFRIKEADELIKVVRMGRDICINDQIHGKAPVFVTRPPPCMVDD